MSNEMHDWILRAHEKSFQRAFETAVRTKTALVFFKDGEVVKVYPPYRYELVPEEPKEK
ncbi:hypothetical protein [Candidatus Neptunochlamydia vexilliferae]|uniref:Uncharacterized protein n=1 Tax=Candidatus Neptunichlamydia vexilliferae TaxID=1651774 RepID=A0ABS0AXW6_9BACT|nr:hypothetical protein [Candidatus Neptunochlamydia vexilliferae]MBF5058978.1 hypothetical protein [Candidatus Neptunochlamydia vexilliferae]